MVEPVYFEQITHQNQVTGLTDYRTNHLALKYDALWRRDTSAIRDLSLTDSALYLDKVV